MFRTADLQVKKVEIREKRSLVCQHSLLRASALFAYPASDLLPQVC